MGTRAGHLGVVISQIKDLQPGIGFMGSRSTPILILDIGMYFSATYNLRYEKIPTTRSGTKIDQDIGV